MMCDLDRTKVVLGNTTNKLMSLQHTQFVENRVYDDDDEIVGNVPVELPSTANEEKITLVEALQSVLDSGMKVMDKYYERVSFELSDDSDDEPDKTDHQRYFFFHYRIEKSVLTLRSLPQCHVPAKRSIQKSTIAIHHRI